MTTTDAREEVQDVMKRSDAVFLSTIDGNGFPSTRAMLNLRNPKNFPALESFMRSSHDIYFTTNTSLPKTAQISSNPKVCAYFCLPAEWRACAVQGEIEIVSDRNEKAKLWQDGWTMYYPGGIDDPEYTVFRLKPSHIKGYKQLTHYTLLPGEL